VAKKLLEVTIVDRVYCDETDLAIWVHRTREVDGGNVEGC
jgi:hypothetical protein